MGWGLKSTGKEHQAFRDDFFGFTTDFDDARSSTYCTAVAYVTDSPVIHVNGDDAEAVVYAIEFAVDFRQKFHKDIFKFDLIINTFR